MTKMRALGFCVVCFTLGALTNATIAQHRGPTFNTDLFAGKAPGAAATALLDGALALAGDGSWERIAVGCVWYLGGEKAKGLQIFDGVTSNRKVASSDWFRIGRVYAEAGEWPKAENAFDRALAMDADDDSGTIEYAALANLNHDRAKAEQLFTKVMTKKPREFWHWVGAGGSYLGVRPQ
jgi:tetratricopeptide (TPR) repeat protein